MQLKVLFIMYLITTLKETLKSARTSGKINKQQWRTYDPASHLTRGRPTSNNPASHLTRGWPTSNNPGNFCDYILRLSDEEWLQFEAERAFRNILDTLEPDQRQN